MVSFFLWIKTSSWSPVYTITGCMMWLGKIREYYSKACFLKKKKKLSQQHKTKPTK